MKYIISPIISLMPLVAFFIASKYYTLIVATIVLVIASAIAMLAEFLLFKKLPTKIEKISFAVLLAFGLLTYLLEDVTYIKMKPTVIYLSAALIFIYSLFAKKAFSARMIDKILPGRHIDKKKADGLFAIAFIICALSNEFVWRNFSESYWVSFKVFIMPCLVTMLLFISVKLSMIRGNR